MQFDSSSRRFKTSCTCLKDSQKNGQRKKLQPENWARRKFCNENLRWWEKRATQNYCLNSEITEKTTEKRQAEKWAVALFPTISIFVAEFSCCPFSRCLFSVAVISHINFVLPCFPTLSFFITDSSNWPIFRLPFFSCPIFSLPFLPFTVWNAYNWSLVPCLISGQRAEDFRIQIKKR